MITQLRGYSKGLSFKGLCKNGKLNPLVLINNNIQRQLEQKQAAKTALDQLLTQNTLVFRWFDNEREIHVFNWLKQSQRRGQKIRGSTKKLHVIYQSYYANYPQANTCLRYFEDALRRLSKQGIITRYKEQASDGYQQYTYHIDFPSILNAVPDFNQQWNKILRETGDFLQEKKVCQIIIDRYVIDIDDKRKTQHKFINFNSRRENFVRKERTAILPEWQAGYETRNIIKYTYPQIGDFYIQAAESIFRKHNIEQNKDSDDWDNKFKHYVFMSIRKGWRTISWAAWKLQKECNQKDQSVIDTQPRVVMTEQFEILKNAIAATTDRRRSMANILLSGTTLVDNKLKVSLKANTAREWAQYLPTIKEYVEDISYRSFAGVQEIVFIEV